MAREGQKDRRTERGSEGKDSASGVVSIGPSPWVIVQTRMQASGNKMANMGGRKIGKEEMEKRGGWCMWVTCFDAKRQRRDVVQRHVVLHAHAAQHRRLNGSAVGHSLVGVDAGRCQNKGGRATVASEEPRVR